LERKYSPNLVGEIGGNGEWKLPLTEEAEVKLGEA
jgi:hypothetical protein